MGRRLIKVEPGDDYGLLTIVREDEPEPRECPPGSAYRRFIVRCECGAETRVRLSNLRTGSTRSCGAPHHRVQLKRAS